MEAEYSKTRRPPKPRLVFRVGVVGHRPNRLPGDTTRLEEVIASMLNAIHQEVVRLGDKQSDLFDDSKPVLRAVSPLAEGTDRIFAKAALKLDYELCVPMPFHQEEYEKDFIGDRAEEPDSLNSFRSLLESASRKSSLRKFELDGSRNDSGAAYGAAGNIVLNQADLLIVVWDGERLGKRGGTEETLDEAVRRGVPTVWIDGHSPHSWQVVCGGRLLPESKNGRVTPSSDQNPQDIKDFIQRTVGFSDIDEQEGRGGPPKNARSLLTIRDFYSERKPLFNPAIVWKCFRDFVGNNRVGIPPLSVPDFEESVEYAWPRDESTPAAKVVNRLRPFYAWPDKLAVIYSDTYRSAFVLAFLLAAAAVFMALLPFGIGQQGHHHWIEGVCIVSELFIILTILGLVHFGRRKRWHERWLDYRIAAEFVRHLRLVAPLGGQRPFPPTAGHLKEYDHPESTWVASYIRAVERDIGLPSTRLDSKQLVESLDQSAELLERQVDYHGSTARRCENIEHRLHSFGVTLLALTLISCGIHVLPLFPSLGFDKSFPPWLPSLLTFFCGFLPALGAALAGINNQGEFRRIAKRSHAMVGQLKQILEEVVELRKKFSEASAETSQAPSSREVTALTTNVAELLVNESLDWRVVFLDRPIVSPS